MNIIIYYKAKTYTKPHSPYYVMRFMVLSRKVLFPGMIQKSCWLEDCQTKSATLQCSQYELLNPCGDPWELPADAFKFTPSHIPLYSVITIYMYIPTDCAACTNDWSCMVWGAVCPKKGVTMH